MTVDQGPILSEAEANAIRRGVPDPGIPTPVMAIPTAILYVATLALWIFATWLLFGADTSAWITIPIHTAVSFMMFTVLHESAHHATGRANWVNELLGRLSMPFVASFASFPALRHVHIEHHRNTNEDRSIDPDSFSTHGPALLMPLRWATQDLYYAYFWGMRIRRRPLGEVFETLACAAATIAVIAWAGFGGWMWELAVLYLVPQRIGLFILAWWFDWLPHHGLTATHAEDRYRATRVRVGVEWFLTPVLLYQNYHLVHHLHPSIPFYRYIKAWNRNRDAYLANNSAIITAWGNELTPSEYRAWRNITTSYDVTPPAPTVPKSIHQMTVEEVRPLTDDAVSIAFTVPAESRDRFHFLPGQHVAVHVEIDGVHYRRAYSICAAATSGLLRIGVKRVEGGAVSTYLTSKVEAGTVLGVEEPTGRFTLAVEPRREQHYVGIAAGSGITPIISMLSTALLVEEDSRFTLLYGNRTPESTMFAEELEMLARQFEGRLQVVHLLDGVDNEEIRRLNDWQERHDERLRCTHYAAGPITPEQLTEVAVSPAQVAGWFLCGPRAMVQSLRDHLGDEVGIDRVHVELFNPEVSARAHDGRDTITAVTATLGGKRTTFPVDGSQSLLDGALDSSVAPPYACMGGACGTCRAKVIAGAVEMDNNLVLSDTEVADGYVLTCQSYPSSDYVDIDYDA